MMKQLLFLGSLLAALAGSAAELPPLVLPEGVGVDVHFTEAQPGELEQIAATGCRFVRADFSWAATEQERGRFDFSTYDRLLSSLRKNRMRALLVLRCANPIYAPITVVTNSATGAVRSGVASPVPPAAITGFARWAAAAASHFKGQEIIWEIECAPGDGTGTQQSRAESSAMLASSAGAAMRATDPAVTVITPGAHGFAWDFLESFGQSGVLGYFHGFSVHPFRSPSRPPESVGADYRKLRAQLDKPIPNRPRARGSQPILSSEWGYSSARDSLSPEVQADYLVRQQLFNLLQEVPISIWYDWMNDGANPENEGHNFGLVTHRRQPKPAYFALQMMTRELAGYRIERRVETGDEKVFVLLMSKPGEPPKLAAWTIGEPLTISLDIEAEQGKGAKTGVCNIRGETYLPKIKDGKLSLEISGTPQFVALADLRLKPAVPTTAPEKKPAAPVSTR